MKVEKKPYELLVRWGADGSVQGATIAYMLKVTDDNNTVISSSQTNGLAITLGIEEGFPFNDVFDEVQLSLLQATEVLRDENLLLKNQVQNIQTEKDDLILLLASKETEIEELTKALQVFTANAELEKKENLDSLIEKE